jgi:Amt family ammonium transporter
MAPNSINIMTIYSELANGKTFDEDAPARKLLGSNEDNFWLLFGAYLVFFMQLGFALLEAGSVRAKNTKNILLKNVMDACLGAIIWWSVGYPFAFGAGSSDDFIGSGDFFLYNHRSWERQRMADYAAKIDGEDVTYGTWMFQWAFAATAATIVSGAVAERCRFSAYLAYTTILTGFIYPVVVHWGWSGDGWMSPWDYGEDEAGEDFAEAAKVGGNDFIDFAGSGIVHMTGGGAALMGAIVLGPRMGRFDASGAPVDMPGHSTVLATMGTFILWFGWYAFNPCSTLLWGSMHLAAKVAINTTLGAAGGGVVSFLLGRFFTGTLDIGPALNGILGGLVSITGPCATVDPWAALIIGFIGGAVYYGASKMLLMLKIDDPLDASPVHFFCGMWGVISTGLFSSKSGVEFAAFSSHEAEGAKHYGAFMGGGGEQLGIQFVGMLAIAAWTCGMSLIMFLALKYAGILRVPPEEESEGLDTSHHGGSAYDLEGKA